MRKYHSDKLMVIVEERKCAKIVSGDNRVFLINHRKNGVAVTMEHDGLTRLRQGNSRIYSTQTRPIQQTAKRGNPFTIKPF